MSKYEMAKQLIENNFYKESLMLTQLAFYKERGELTQEEYSELIELIAYKGGSL